MRVELVSAEPLRFADGSPVRAASAMAAYGDGLLVVQDDSTHACWLQGRTGTPLRVLPPVDGHEDFGEPDGTKHLKPDLESACVVPGGVLLLGSGSTPARMRAVLLPPPGEQDPVVADLPDLYAAVASALRVEEAEVNLEGACVVGERLRWFQRGRPDGGVPSASVDLDLSVILSVVLGETDGGAPVWGEMMGNVCHYELGAIDGIGLAVTDAASLGGETVVVSAAAEDSPNAYDDGPVVGGALVLLHGRDVMEVAELPRLRAGAPKVEGLSVLDWTPSGGRLLAVVDHDDPTTPSDLLTLDVRI